MPELRCAARLQALSTRGDISGQKVRQTADSRSGVGSYSVWVAEVEGLQEDDGGQQGRHACGAAGVPSKRRCAGWRGVTSHTWAVAVAVAVAPAPPCSSLRFPFLMPAAGQDGGRRAGQQARSWQAGSGGGSAPCPVLAQLHALHRVASEQVLGKASWRARSSGSGNALDASAAARRAQQGRPPLLLAGLPRV